MIPLVDMHCHLLPSTDDGPRTDGEAVEMCRMALAEGTTIAAAVAHQNEQWPSVTPERIRERTASLRRLLHDAGIPLLVFPTAEVMVCPDLESRWSNGELMSVADRRQYLLLEMPHSLFVDLVETTRNLCRLGVRPILAHPERNAALLHDPDHLERLVRAGCLMQVSASSVTDVEDRPTARLLKDWFQRGLAHCIGSDGHSLKRRPPHLAAAYRQIARWAGDSIAQRVCSTIGMAILQGLPLNVPAPTPRRRNWIAKLWS